MPDRTLFRNRLITFATVHFSPRHHRRQRERKRLAARYLAGRGLEIGALHMPVSLPPAATARFVDYQTSEQRRQTYPHLDWVRCVPVDVLDDGQTLETVEAESQDFVIANHVIEHCEDTIGAIRSWLRVLRPGGVLYMAVPDMRHTFDSNRALTPSSHVLRDHREGPGTSRREHWEEFAARRRIPETEIDAWIDRNLAMDQRPHFHVWTRETFEELLGSLKREVGLPIEIEEVRPVEMEFVVILRKRSAE